MVAGLYTDTALSLLAHWVFIPHFACEICEGAELLCFGGRAVLRYGFSAVKKTNKQKKNIAL